MIRDYVDAMLALVNDWYVMTRTGLSGKPSIRAPEPMLDRVEKIDAGNARLLAFRGEIAQNAANVRAVQLGQRAVAGGTRRRPRIRSLRTFLRYRTTCRHLSRKWTRLSR